MDKERKVVELNLDDILPNRFQPRIKFDEEAITELSESIKEHGVIQPIVVRPIADKFEIIAGERRYKASLMAGKTTIPAIVTDLDDKESAEVALIENVQRQDLTPIEEAVSYKKILDMGYLTQNQLADKLGKDQSTVANKLRLLNLDDEVQEALLDEKISERHARSLLKIKKADQRELLHKIIEKRLTVRKTDEEINKILGITKKTEQPVIEPKAKVQPEVTEVPVQEPVVETLEAKEELPVPEVEVLEINKDEPMNPTDNMNVFNIPTSPIVEEVEELPSVEPVVAPIIQEEIINPGFMNIENIENNATDIFQEAPVADVDNLLKPSEIELAPAVEQPEEEPEIRPGKFFNLFDDEDETEGEQLVPEVQPLSFAGFEQAVMPEAPAYVEPVVEPMAEIKPEVTEVPVQESVVETLEVNEPEEEIEELVVEPLPMMNESIIEPIAYEKNAFEPVIEPIIEPINNFSLDQDIEETLSHDPVVENITINENPIAPDYSFESDPEPVINIPTAPTNTFVAGDMKTVINTIRTCAETIEKFGFVVDVDEFDFEDIYQVIFKIEKRK